jgi:Resolvase, N terminal domain
MRVGASFRTAMIMAASRVPPSTALPCKTSWPMSGPARSPSSWSIRSTASPSSCSINRVSFVSITQSFNTTSSKGRLTLNVLLFFAQFEREVIGERVRDKIAASKRKGLWVGGPVPLG